MAWRCSARAICEETSASSFAACSLRPASFACSCSSFRSSRASVDSSGQAVCELAGGAGRATSASPSAATPPRSEEHTSELQSRLHLVCRLLLEKKKQYIMNADELARNAENRQDQVRSTPAFST